MKKASTSSGAVLGGLELRSPCPSTPSLLLPPSLLSAAGVGPRGGSSWGRFGGPAPLSAGRGFKVSAGASSGCFLTLGRCDETWRDTEAFRGQPGSSFSPPKIPQMRSRGRTGPKDPVTNLVWAIREEVRVGQPGLMQNKTPPILPSSLTNPTGVLKALPVPPAPYCSQGFVPALGQTPFSLPHLAAGFERDGEVPAPRSQAPVANEFNPQPLLEEPGQQRRLPCWRQGFLRIYPLGKLLEEEPWIFGG